MGISQSLTHNKPEYVIIQNSVTGEQAVIDVKMSRYRKISRGFLNSARLNPYFFKHISLDQAKESYKPKHINNFLNCLRRFYGDIIYIWSVEVQEGRLEKYGESVLHWHFIIGFEWGTQIEKEDILRIQKYWKFGRAQITPVKKLNINYLLKYITKALNSPVESLYKIRKIGTSRIESWLRQSWKAILDLYEIFKSALPGLGIDCLSEFYWQNGNAYLWEEWELGGLTGKLKRYIYKKPRSKWFKVSEATGEPF